MKIVFKLVLLLCVGMTHAQFQGHLYNPHSPHRGSVSTGHFPGGSVSGGHFPGGSISGGHFPGGSVGGGHFPGGSIGGGHFPGGRVSGGHFPGGSISGGYFPGGSIGGGHFPGGSIGGGHFPGGSVSGGHFPGGSTGTGHSPGGPFPGSAPSPSNSGSSSSGGDTNNSPAPATSAPSSSETSNGQITEHYKTYAGIHCDGSEHKTAENHYHETETIESCFEACDAAHDCVAFAIRDNWSIGGCYLKKESCLENMNPKPGVTMFVKPRPV